MRLLALFIAACAAVPAGVLDSGRARAEAGPAAFMPGHGASPGRAAAPRRIAQATPAPSPQTRKKLQVAYVKNLSFTPLYLAIEKGYLASEGIDAELKIVQSASEVVAFLGRGQIDVAFGNIGVPLFNAAARDIDVRVVGGVTYAPKEPTAPSPNPIIARKALTDAGTVKAIADLKGRKLAMNTRGGVIEYQYALALKSGRMALSDVSTVLISFPDTLAALTNGAVDAAILPEPLATAAQQRGIAAVVVPNPAPGLLITVLIAGSNMLEEKDGKSLDAFLRGIRRAANELQSREAVMSPANLEIWSRYTGIPAPVIARTVPYTYARDLALDVDDLMRQQRYLLESGQIKSEQPASKLVAARFAKRL